MADRVRRVNYAYLMVPNRPGQGARITDELREAGGKGRYGMLLWVRPKDYARAAAALGAR
jgi:hypothetical protein